jgi:hypothetical protein
MGGIFGLKRESVTGNWRKLQNVELHDMYSSDMVKASAKRRVI